jgi:cytoskeletal protein CcmA (bactofilin family)
MSEHSSMPARRFTDRPGSGPTLIGAGAEFHGDLRCSGDLGVSGSITGDGDVRGALTLADGARWEGTVHAANAVLAGRIVGHVVIREKLEIRRTAHISGSVAAKIIAIAEGAVIEGDIEVRGDAPVVRFKEKRED